jgi:SWI/SNF-related matrix-associated actin-dependent regulator 1 of chromatin subfamily A
MLVTEDDIEQVFRFGSPQEVRLRDGGIKFIRLAQPTPQKVQFFHQNRLLLAQRGIVHRTRWGGLPGEMEFAWWLDRPALVEERREEAFEASAAVSSDFRVPMGGGIVLRPYQAAGAEYLHKRKGWLLADSIGLGKTLTTVGVINCNPKIDRILVICPHKVRGVWWNELNRGLVRRRSIAFAEGGVWPTTDIVITHYQICHRFEAQLTGYMWDMVIIDEGHFLRNRKARMTRTILGGRADHKKGLAACTGIPGRVKAILTGTPLANVPMDLFPYLRWADRETWGSYSDFEREYHLNSDGHARLHRKLREWGMLRRRKEDVAKDLPELTRTMVVIEAHTPDQFAVVARDRGLMASHEEDLKRAMSEKDFADDVEGNVIRALKIPATELSRMRKATAEALFPDALEQAQDILEQEDKLLIFAHHRDIVFRLLEALREFRPVHCIGGMSSSDLAQSITTFQRDPGCRVFIASITATGTGVDGLQESCSTCLFVEDDWLAVMGDQAAGRLHRIGQKKHVNSYHMALEGSIGIRILKVSMDKRRIADRVIDGSDAPAPDSGVLAVKSYKPKSIFSKQRTGKIGTGMLPGLFR